MKLKKQVVTFIKNETVLCIAAVLALLSMGIVWPNSNYVTYIDFRTLVLLFCLMAVVSGWKKGWVFEHVARFLLGKVKNTRQLVFLLVCLCFFSAMFITNDVALITFVPFSVLILTRAQKQEKIIYTVVLQTIAANLGSMLLPVGNPQNLYLYGQGSLGMGAFVVYMLPIWLLSFAMIIFAVIPMKKEIIQVEPSSCPKMQNARFYGGLFVLCLGTVIGWLPYYVLFGIVLATILIKDRRVLLNVDYMLLLTFVCFFIFIGNVKNMPEVADALAHFMAGRELLMGILASQFISNVPAAILLSGFTQDIGALLWGTNIGGLGTLIASMASLISYKIYMQTEQRNGKKYLAVFTGINVLFLVVLVAFGMWYKG